LSINDGLTRIAILNFEEFSYLFEPGRNTSVYLDDSARSYVMAEIKKNFGDMPPEPNILIARSIQLEGVVSEMIDNLGGYMMLEGHLIFLPQILFRARGFA